MTRTFAGRRDGRREVAGLISEIQQLTSERRRLVARGADGMELEANERSLDELRWLLADAARRSAVEPATAA
ncbi:MAG TPA: hypothetical protein VFM67_04605 [Gaiella sp.]|jgi:hypothetical protein|nr:hypothetical protein [Gaiella sp.]